MYHPWRRFRVEAQWTLQVAPLPRGRMGRINWHTRTITIARGLLQAERRCTITHELIHLERGPAPADPRLRQREERAVEAETARRLITLDALADALAWSRQPTEIADELWVDQRTLDVRVAGLNRTERAELDARLTDEEDLQ